MIPNLYVGYDINITKVKKKKHYYNSSGVTQRYEFGKQYSLKPDSLRTRTNRNYLQSLLRARIILVIELHRF